MTSSYYVDCMNPSLQHFLVIYLLFIWFLVIAQVFSRMTCEEKPFCEPKTVSLSCRLALFFFSFFKLYFLMPRRIFISVFFPIIFTATCHGGNQFAVASNARNFNQSTAIMICKQHNAKLPRLITTTYLSLCITNGLGELAKVSKQDLQFWVSNTTGNGLVWAFDANVIRNAYQKNYRGTVKFVACETGKLSTDIFQKK